MNKNQWVLSLIFCCIFEYKLFGDKKKKDKELTGGLKRQ